MAVMDAGYGPARAEWEPHTPSPHPCLEQAGTVHLTLHIEKDGSVVGLTGGRVGHGAVELVVGALAGEGEDAGSVRSGEVDFLFLTVEVPGQCGTGDWLGNPAGEDTTLSLLQGARCSRLPANGGVQFPQCCQRAHSTSELRQGSSSRSHAPDSATASPAKQSARRLSSRNSRRARAAPGQPLGHPMLYQPCSALGERQLEQGHEGVHPRWAAMFQHTAGSEDVAQLHLTCSIAAPVSSPVCSAALRLGPGTQGRAGQGSASGAGAGPAQLRAFIGLAGPRHGCELSSVSAGPGTAPSPHCSRRAPARLRALTALAGPRRRLPRAGSLSAAAGSVPGQRAPSRASNLPSSRKGSRLGPTAPPISTGLRTMGITPQCLQWHKQSPGAGNRGRFIGGGAEPDKQHRCFGTFQSLAVSQEEEKELWHLRLTFSGRQDMSAGASSGARLYPDHCLAHLLPVSVASSAIRVAQPTEHFAEHLVAEGRVGVEKHELLPGEGAAQARCPLQVPPGILVPFLQAVDEAALHEALAGGTAAAPAQADGSVQVLKGTWQPREALVGAGGTRGTTRTCAAHLPRPRAGVELGRGCCSPRRAQAAGEWPR